MSSSFFPVGMFCLFLINMLCFVSCHKKTDVAAQLAKLQEKPISLDIEEMHRIDGDTSIIDLKRLNNSSKLLVYVDSSNCTACFMYHMTDYLILKDKLQESKVMMFFIIEPKKGEESRISLMAKRHKSDFLVFIDSCHSFRRINYIPQNTLMHTMLLDDKNRVVMAGDPLRNKDVERLLYEAVDRMY